MMFVKNRGSVLGFFMALIGVLLFSAKAVLVKLCYLDSSEVNSISILMLRMLFSFPFYISLLIISSLRSNKIESVTHIFVVILLGLFGYYLASYFDFQGLVYISASLERLILFVYPTLVVLLNRIFFKEKISKYQLASILITYLGLILIFVNPSSSNDTSNSIIKGAVFIFMASFTYAIYLVGTQWKLKYFGANFYTAIAMTSACIGVFVQYLIIEGFYFPSYSAKVYMYCFFMAVFSTVLPSFLIANAIEIIGSNSVSIIGSMGPVSTIVLSMFFLGEMISVTQLVGGLIIIVGVLIVKIK